MKRILLSILGTTAGLVALLSFKTPGHQVAATGGLPAASINGANSTPAHRHTTNPTQRHRHATTSAPPTPGRHTTTHAATKSYVGSQVQTQYGVVQVAIKVQGTQLVNVSFVKLTAFDGHSQQINSAAAPILLHETLSAQNAHINTVSGATYTSNGYLQSLQSALDQAGIK